MLMSVCVSVSQDIPYARTQALAAAVCLCSRARTHPRPFAPCFAVRFVHMPAQNTGAQRERERERERDGVKEHTGSPLVRLPLFHTSGCVWGREAGGFA